MTRLSFYKESKVLKSEGSSASGRLLCHSLFQQFIQQLSFGGDDWHIFCQIINHSQKPLNSALFCGCGDFSIPATSSGLGLMILPWETNFFLSELV